MLPKKAYNKVLQGLKHIRANWDEDRVENPRSVPYEIDNELDILIERCIREERVNCHGTSNRDILIKQTKHYLIEKGLVVGSPYGGIMFPLPEDNAPLPSKEEFIADVKKRLDINF